MTRYEIIDRIGSEFIKSNIEGGEYSYVKAAGSRELLKAALGHNFDHFKLDIRFETSDVVILVETKQLFTESDIQQLKEYLEEEIAIHGSSRVICILANTNNNDIKVWKNIIDDDHLLRDETVIDNISHYASLFTATLQNDRETVLRNTYALNELLHRIDIDENLRSQFVGTTLLYIKNLMSQRGNPIIDDELRSNLKEFWKNSGAVPIRAAIAQALKDLLNESENKTKKIELLQNNVLNNQKVKNLSTENWVLILDTILGNIYRYINTDTSEGQDILNMFFIAFNKYTGKADKNQAFTPDHITEFMCRITNVDCTKVILDGTCGSGSFLVQAMVKELADCSRGRTESEALSQKKIVKEKHIFGIESEEKAYGLSTTNMLIHGDGNSNIRFDSIFNSKSFIKKANPDIILMNPPYNAKPLSIPDCYKVNWGTARNGKEDPTKGFVFIQYLSDVLQEINREREAEGLPKKEITLSVLLPMAAAIGSNSILTESKRIMLEHNRLEAVFTLPYEIFHPGANVYTCCMVFTLGKPHRNSDGTVTKTFFGLYTEDGFKKKKNLGRVEQFDSNNTSKWKKIEEKWIEAYRNREVIDGFSAMAVVDENSEWLCEAHIETDYSKLNINSFQQTINGYLAYHMKHGKWNIIKDFIGTFNAENQNTSFTIDVTTWKEFEITKLFDIQRGTISSLNDIDEGNMPIVSASGENEGISFYGDVSGKFRNNITFSMNGVNTGFTAYHSYIFNANADCGILLQKFEMNAYTGIFLSTIIALLRIKYCYGRKMTKERIENEVIKLPIKCMEDGSPVIDSTHQYSISGYIPDWKFMENFIKNLPYNK